MRNSQDHMVIEEVRALLDLNTAIFITINPGYAGRVEIPVNLRNLFRSTQMVVPDSLFITEILLYNSGFVNSTDLARKLCHVQMMAAIVML